VLWDDADESSYLTSPLAHPYRVHHLGFYSTANPVAKEITKEFADVFDFQPSVDEFLATPFAAHQIPSSEDVPPFPGSDDRNSYLWTLPPFPGPNPQRPSTEEAPNPANKNHDVYFAVNYSSNGRYYTTKERKAIRLRGKVPEDDPMEDDEDSEEEAPSETELAGDSATVIATTSVDSAGWPTGEMEWTGSGSGDFTFDSTAPGPSPVVTSPNLVVRRPLPPHPYSRRSRSPDRRPPASWRPQPRYRSPPRSSYRRSPPPSYSSYRRPRSPSPVASSSRRYRSSSRRRSPSPSRALVRRSPTPVRSAPGPLNLPAPEVTGSVVYMDGETGTFQRAAIVHLPPPPPTRRTQRRIERSEHSRRRREQD
jgi:hypothetical protein